MWRSSNSRPSSRSISSVTGMKSHGGETDGRMPAAATRSRQCASSGASDSAWTTFGERAWRVNLRTTTPSLLSGRPSAGRSSKLRSKASAISAFTSPRTPCFSACGASTAAAAAPSASGGVAACPSGPPALEGAKSGMPADWPSLPTQVHFECLSRRHPAMWEASSSSSVSEWIVKCCDTVRRRAAAGHGR